MCIRDRLNLKALAGGIVVNDEEVKNSIKVLAEHLKIIVEPGGGRSCNCSTYQKN